MPIAELLNTGTQDRVRNILQKFHVKIKFSSKVIAHEIRGTNFWDTP